MSGSGFTPMQQLVERLAKLPGVGNRSAQRMAMYLLKASPEEAQLLADAIVDLNHNARQCSCCQNLSPSDPCAICADPRRDHSQILVVEQPGDVASFEATGLYRGVYHVLMGRLSPLDGLGPGELTITALLSRIQKSVETSSQTAPVSAATGPVREVILGTNPTLESDGTALYLARELSLYRVKVTRLARGLPTGYSLDQAAKAVLADALEERRAMT